MIQSLFTPIVKGEGGVLTLVSEGNSQGREFVFNQKRRSFDANIEVPGTHLVLL